MKTSRVLKIVVLTGWMLVGTVACNKNDSNDNRGRGASTAAAAAAAGNGYYTKAIGTVTNALDMTDQARYFLENESLSMDEIGAVDGYNGVSFSGIVRFDTANRLRPAESYITIKIVDDLAKSGQAAPLNVTISNAQSSGYVSYSANNGGAAYAEIIFKDDYGTVTMVGNFDNYYFTGDMNYENYVTHREGKLGQFRVSTCGFFVCGK